MCKSIILIGVINKINHFDLINVPTISGKIILQEEK